MTAPEDIIKGGTGGVPVGLAKGTDGQVLTVVAGALAWATPGAGAAQYAALAFTFGDGATAIVAATEPDQWLEVPFACTIVSARLLADAAGSIVVDVWKDSYAGAPPTVADAITASAKPTLSSAVKAEDVALTGWTTTLARGDWLRVHVDSAAVVRRAVLSLGVQKT
jgi:hypothetical protein